MRYSLQRRLERLAGDRWARQGLRTLLRSFWIGISLLCLGLAGNLLLGWNISLSILITAVLGCVLVGALLLLRRRMPSPEVARRLDDRFELHEQLRTALEVNARSEQPEGVEQRLLEQAHITTGQIQRYIARRKKQPWVEIMSLLAVVLLSLGLFFLLNLTPPAALPSAEALRDLENPDVQQQNQPDQGNQQQQNQQAGSQDQGQGQGTQQQQTAQGSSIDQMSAAALADAMRDQGVTRPAAEALDQSNTAEAAQHLRELADQSSELSSETRRELAEELRDAAADIESRNPELAEQVRDSAYGMQQSEQSSAEAFENLADAVEQLDGSGQQNEQQAQQNQQDSQQQQQQGQPAGGGVGNASGEQREQPESSERLGVEGVPLELESNGEGDTPTEGDESTISAGGSGFEANQGGSPDDETVQMDDDPLRIPADLRDVVQEYFSPTE